jgi:hypothetical protein
VATSLASPIVARYAPDHVVDQLMRCTAYPYLDEGNLDVVLDVRVPLPHVAHDEVAKLAAELDAGGASADDHAVQEPRLLLLRQAWSRSSNA